MTNDKLPGRYANKRPAFGVERARVPLTVVLADLAGRCAARFYHPYCATLSRGLQIKLRRTPARWYLRLARVETAPSSIELQTVLSALPAECHAPRRGTAARTKELRGPRGLYALTLVWRDAAEFQPTLFE